MSTRMEIRDAHEGDIPHIVSLLRLSLGETLMPKSEAFWRWKHIDNPFGKSPVLVCWENGVLIGVRAFMRWEWNMNGRVYRSVRAVDTATHPEHQGKGIFRMLTLNLVEKCEKEGIDFVFNTPNLKSKPGYLKMGWFEAGRLPIKVSFNLLNLVRRRINRPDAAENLLIEYGASRLCSHDLDNILSGISPESSQLTTRVSSSFLRWRYVDVPVARYVALVNARDKSVSDFLIARIKPSKLGNELRIVDVFAPELNASRDLNSQFREMRKSSRAEFSTMSGLTPMSIDLGVPAFKISKGPIVTVRPLACKNLEFLSNFNQWSPSIGDLELF